MTWYNIQGVMNNNKKFKGCFMERHGINQVFVDCHVHITGQRILRCGLSPLNLHL